MKKSLTIAAAPLGLIECKRTSWTDDGATCTGNVLYSTIRSARCS